MTRDRRAVRVEVDEGLAAVDHEVATAADDWLDDPRGAGVYGRLVAAIEARRALLRSRPDLSGAEGMAAGAGVHPRKKADVTRARVLDSAAKVFCRKGYTGTRLTDIAAEAKIHSGSIYYHFRTREELVDEVLRVGQERVDSFVRERVDALPAGTTNLDRLRELMTAHLQMVLKIGDYTGAMIRIIGEVPGEVHQRRLQDQRQYGDYWRSLFKQAQASGDLRTDVDLSAMMMLILGALNSSPDWYRSREGLRAVDLGSTLGTLFLTGLAPDRGSAPDVPAGPPVGGLPGPPASAGEARGSASRARILDAAAEVLREQGYAGTRLTSVAAVAGLRPGSLYYHFRSREDLFANLLSEAWVHANGLVRRAVEDLPADASHVDRVSAAMTAHLLSVLGRNTYTSGLLRIVGQFPEEVQSPSLPEQRAFTAYWCRLLQDAQNAGEIRADMDVHSVAMVLIGTSNWAVEWYRPGGRLDVTTLAEQFTTMVFHGLSHTG